MEKCLCTINEKIEKDAQRFVNDTDIDFFDQILRASQHIIKNAATKPIVLLSGPSGSGKTTTALMIEKFLDNEGHEVHTISLDDYFQSLGAADLELLKQHKLDLESPSRVDSKFLNDQLMKMINCEEIELQKFDFVNSVRRGTGKYLKRAPNDIVVIEGIHSLNPEVITIPDENTTKLYVSVRTRIKGENGVVLHPKYIRLLRRMLRDKKFRQRDFSGTAKMFESVQHGENKFIMPFKGRADFSIDTFINYEISAYKYMLEQGGEVLPDSAVTNELKEILSQINPVQDSLVPKTSLIREFMGNGQFEY